MLTLFTRKESQFFFAMIWIILFESHLKCCSIKCEIRLLSLKFVQFKLVSKFKLFINLKMFFELFLKIQFNVFIFFSTGTKCCYFVEWMNESQELKVTQFFSIMKNCCCRMHWSFSCDDTLFLSFKFREMTYFRFCWVITIYLCRHIDIR